VAIARKYRAQSRGETLVPSFRKGGTARISKLIAEKSKHQKGKLRFSPIEKRDLHTKRGERDSAPNVAFNLMGSPMQKLLGRSGLAASAVYFSRV